MPDSRAQAYAEQLDALTRAAEALTPEAQKRILALLEAARREIVADLAGVDPKSYSAARLQALKAQVDRVMGEFASQASSQVEKIQEQAWTESARSIDAAVAAGTARLAASPVLDRSALQVIQGYTADLIGGISRDAAAKIVASIQRAYLGGSDLTQLVNQIGGARYGSEWTGLFGQAGRKTVDVAMNEIMRVNSVASMARINDLAERHPTLGKGWRHIPVAHVPRISHILANGQVRKPSEPFDVGGEQLMYPRDPSGSPENTIFCHCLMYPALAAEDLQPTDRERDLLKSLGISVVPNGP
jgi:hypothetical protein